jgi:acetyl/propionyl-CoA carboxylase alpha subunit
VIAPARHIEVQLLGDRAGTIVAVGERDCSLQRRHQKLIEESPAPGLTDAERESVHEHAVRVARAAGLQNAATAEFLFDADRRFWFLEVNTRLQVEHGVTELTADIDLVREQFEIAAGRPLSARIIAAAERASHPTRHAIEVRLAAEDPGREFAAAPGRIGRWSMPSGPGIRVDTAVAAGDRVPPEYDPLIAKLLVVDLDRDAAISRLRRALDEVEISGVQTTLPFHRFVAAHPGFSKGQLSTGWVADHWAPVVADLRRDAFRTAAAAASAVATEAGMAGVAPTAPNSRARHGGDGPPPDAGLPGQSRSGWREAGRAAATDRWPR